MKRSKKMVVLSHCILNVNAKVEGFDPYPSMMKEVLDLLHQKGYGILQLPCPETSLYGMSRWGMVKEQLSHSYGKEAMRKLLKPTIHQIETYLDNGYHIPLVIGIDGSPSCGVHFTCSNTNWKGEMSSHPDLSSLLKEITLLPEKGIFMELLEEELKSRNIHLSFLAVDEEKYQQSIETIKAFIDEII